MANILYSTLKYLGYHHETVNHSGFLLILQQVGTQTQMIECTWRQYDKTK